jgi:hypothetical protein
MSDRERPDRPDDAEGGPAPPAATVRRGVRALRRLLREQTFDLRGLDVAGFRRWLDARLERWRQDPVFTQRARIRDLRRAHPRLHALEQEHRRAARAEAAAAHSSRLRRLEQELLDADKAVSGLTAALREAGPERRAALRGKLDAFRERRQALGAEQAALLRECPERQALLRLDAELSALRAATGLDAEEARLAELLRQHGRRSGRSGESFEGLALTLTRSHILPDLLRGSRAAGAEERLRVLPGVTLGAARSEFDQLVVRLPVTAGRPVEVLAVVEVKRNINDVGHGFRRRQEDLAWLTGDAAGYDPRAYRTRHFTTGHFDRPVRHEQDGETFLFAPGSFRRFRRDAGTGRILDRLYFVTRAGPLWGVSAAALARIAFRVATDPRWEPEDVYLEGLLRWCRGLAHAVETPDVLRLYAATPRRGRQVLLL